MTAMIPDRARRLAPLLLAGIVAASTLFGPAGARSAEAAGAPDLALEYDMSPSVQRGQPFTFKVRMTNEGTGATEKGRWLYFAGGVYYGHTISSIDIDSASFACVVDNGVQSEGKPVAVFSCWSQTPFQPGATVTATIQAVASARPGQGTLKGKAYGDADSEPKNDGFTAPFQVN
jgi:hypothetical protein